MTRGPAGEKVRFGVTEWIGIISIAGILIGGWADMRVQHAVAVKEIGEVRTDVGDLKIDLNEIAKDHELRIRLLESERRNRAEP